MRQHVLASTSLVVPLAFLLAGCGLHAGVGSVPHPAAGGEPPPVQREFRGVWVASVANIDWPSRPGLPVDSQQAELLALLDRSAALRLNAVILQVRPAADALYASELEPWSEYLTGEMGKAPEPFYDPLRFAVDEAHRRGLELHAWFNPYRARHPSAKSEVAETHLSRTHPELVRRYGAFLWMDPGEERVREHSMRVMLDAVRRYDLDGVHIDDYFYPYPERDSAGQVIDFPDEPSWSRYVAGGGRLSRADWRRENVNGFVRDLYREIKRAKPWVKFGISPFGVWRPGHPPQVTITFDQHDALYADARKWLVEGWSDYYTPQLYWPIARPDLSYPALLRWWTEQNPRRRHLWPGNFTSRVLVADPVLWPATEIVGQVYVTRAVPGATGNVHFSMRAFMANRDSLNEKLLAGPYSEPALIPASPWLSRSVPPVPRASVGGDAVLRLEPGDASSPMWWVVQWRRADGKWTTEILPGWMRSHPLAASTAEPALVYVMAVNRFGNASRRVLVRWE